ncbi:MAG: chloride channel protein, partial [Thermohalobaculum sp.]|nr:chloride channel protein [Thermohalobaculum sp.]
VAMMRAIFLAEGLGDRVQRLLRLPRWLRPAVAGLALGLIALKFPHIIGVGYETTALALTSQIAASTAVVFAIVKVIAVAATFSGHMGGGVFSPALMLGALTGTAFGALAIDVFPAVAGSQGLYALAGMGAVAAAVLGAPISSTLIVFELTGDWQAGIAVMVAISAASVVADRLVARSFFLTQLDRKGLRLAYGPQQHLARSLRVTHVMRPRGAEDGASDSVCWELHRQGAFLRRGDTLERALPMLDRLKGVCLPVIDDEGCDESGDEAAEPELLGAVFHVDALRAYTRCLEAQLEEEHR